MRGSAGRRPGGCSGLERKGDPGGRDSSISRRLGDLSTH